MHGITFLCSWIWSQVTDSERLLEFMYQIARTQTCLLLEIHLSFTMCKRVWVNVAVMHINPSWSLTLSANWFITPGMCSIVKKIWWIIHCFSNFREFIHATSNFRELMYVHLLHVYWLTIVHLPLAIGLSRPIPISSEMSLTLYHLANSFAFP